MTELGPTGVPIGTFDLKIDKNFLKSRKKSEFHTLRYDFKPKSIAGEPETYIAIDDNDDVNIAIASEGKDEITLYKGAKKPISNGKECLLIFDPAAGEMRLEKVSSNIAVKQTRRGEGNDADRELREEVQRIRPHKPSLEAPRSAFVEPPEGSPKKEKRKHRTSNTSAVDEPTPSNSKAPPIAADEHMSSSSDSDSSSSGDSTDSSDDSDDDEVQTKKSRDDISTSATDGTKRLRLESSNFSSDDEAALEKHLNATAPLSASTSSAKATPQAAPLQNKVDSLFSADMDMPDLSAPSRAPPRKFEKAHHVLQNDLDLSESSDED